MGDNEEEEGNDRWAWLTTTRPMTLTAKARMSRRIGWVFLIRVMMMVVLLVLVLLEGTEGVEVLIDL